MLASEARAFQPFRGGHRESWRAPDCIAPARPKSEQGAMAVVTVLNIAVHNNPAKLLSPFQFEITFECTSALSDDLEWRVIYVGSAESSDHDQELDNVLVGPVPVGTNKFMLSVRRRDRAVPALAA